MNLNQILNRLSEKEVFLKVQKDFKKNLLEIKPIVRDDTGAYRTYMTPDGKSYPSVTTILSASLSDEDRKPLDDWYERKGLHEATRILEDSSGIGNKLHDACEKYLLGETVEAMTDRENRMFKPMLEYLSQRLDVVMGIEIPLYSHKYKIAGTCDCVGIIDGEVTIVDFKNSRKPKKQIFINDYRLQCTMYALMINEMYNLDVEKYKILVSIQDGKFQVFEGNINDHKKALLKRLITFWNAKK